MQYNNDIGDCGIGNDCVNDCVVMIVTVLVAVRYH